MKRGSTHRGNPPSAFTSLEAWIEQGYWFMNFIAPHLDQASDLSGTAPVVNLQPSFMGHHRRPDVLPCQALVDFPELVEYTNPPVLPHLPDEMDTPRGEGQCVGQQPKIFRRQPPPPALLPCLAGQEAVEGRGEIVVLVPRREVGAGALDLGHTAEVATVPKRPAPQAIEPLHHPVTLGLPNREEER